MCLKMYVYFVNSILKSIPEKMIYDKLITYGKITGQSNFIYRKYNIEFIII